MDLLIFLMFPPFFSLIYFFIKFYKKKQEFYFSLISSCILLTIVPMFDIVNTYSNFLYLKELDLKKILEMNISIYNLLYYVTYRLGISFFLTYSLIIILILFCWNKIYTKMKVSNRYLFLYFIGFNTCLYYRSILDITRFTLGTVLFIYFFDSYLRAKERKKYIWKFFILSVYFIHGALLPLIVGVYVFKYFHIKRFKTFWIISLILTFFLSFFKVKILIFILLKIGVLIPNFIKKSVTYYILSNYGFMLKKNLSIIINWELMILGLILIIYIYFSIIKQHKTDKESDFEINLVMLNICLCILVVDNYVVFERYFLLLKIFSFFIIGRFLSKYKARIKFKVLLFVFFLIINYSYNNLVYFKIYYLEQKVSNLKSGYSGKMEILKTIYCPNIIIFLNNKFDDNWLDTWRKR